MQGLEKILEEIEEGTYTFELLGREVDFVAIEWVRGIIRKHANEVWIPVEERLPETDGFYIATMDGEIAGQKIPFTGLAEFENGKWVDDEEDYNCVIAWHPLPDPYNPEDRGEHKQDWKAGFMQRFERRI